MTLQERVLEALRERALTPKALYAAMSNDSPAAIDCAIGALMRSHYVSFELGHYQRTKRQLPPARTGTVSPPPPTSNSNGQPVITPVTPPPPAPAKVPTSPPKTLPVVVSIKSGSESSRRNGPPAHPDGKVAARRAVDALTARQREIYELAQSGLRQSEIAERLGISKGGVKSQLKNARERLGIPGMTGRPPHREPAPESAPPAVVYLRAAPLKEGAEPATGGVELLARECCGVTAVQVDEAGQTIALPPRRQTFSPDLIARLVEMQRSRAMLLQVLCDKVTVCRQELADIEELVRIATARDPA